MRIIFTILFLIISSLWDFQGIAYSQSVQQKLDKLLSDKFFESTHASIDVYDLMNKKTVYQKNNKYFMHPASNMKILTSAAGLFFLGPDYNFETSLFYNGFIDNDILKGDLYIVGGFDPEFTTDDLKIFTDAISSLGIKEVKGNLFADVSRIDTLFWGEGWMWDDDPSTDAPYLSSLNINRNSVEVFVFGIDNEGNAQIVLNPYSSYFNVFNETVIDESENSFIITRDWLNRTNNIVAQGKVRKQREVTGNEIPVRLNVFRPDLYFINLFYEALQLKGIKISGQLDNFWLPYGAVHIATVSRSYLDVIKPLNKISSNLSAEMVMYAMAEKYFGKPATAKNGIKVINNLISLAGMNPDLYRLVDGSGLSHYNLLSAELIISILKYFYYEEPELYQILSDSFPIAGIDGTLERRMIGTSAEKKVTAKTGTLSGVSALSGYITSLNGNVLAFSILMENHVRNTARVRSFQDEICKILTEYK